MILEQTTKEQGAGGRYERYTPATATRSPSSSSRRTIPQRSGRLRPPWDGLNPSITGVEPANSAVLNEVAPVVRFTVSDAGSGFDTGDFDSHVDLYLVPGVDFGNADEVS